METSTNILSIMAAAMVVCLSTASCAGRGSFSSNNDGVETVKPEAIQTTREVSVPSGWNTYVMGDAFRISVPASVEMRGDDDMYTKVLKDVSDATGIQLYDDKQIVFQQAGLSRQTSESYNRYCRIMIQYTKGSYGDFMKANETEELDCEWRTLLRQMVDESLANANLIGEPTYKWVTVNGAKAIQVDYKRQGQDYDSSKSVVCRYYILQNNNEMAKIVLSYRESEAGLWKDDFEKVAGTFSWAI